MLKKIIVLLILISTIELFAQSNANSSSTVSVKLRNGLAINKIGGDLDFGDIIYTGNAITLNRTSDLGIEFEVTGDRNRLVSISYPFIINLDNNDWVSMNGGTRGTLRFLSLVRQTGGNKNYVGSNFVFSGASIRLSNDIPYGKLYLWVGGYLIINANSPYGDYVGTYTITVEY